MIQNINDWASLFSIIAVLITLIAFIIESRSGRLALQTDLLLRLDEKLHSSEMMQLRSKASQKLLSGINPNHEVEQLLEHLSTIAFLYERRAIDADLTYKQFSYWINRYWLCAKDYVVSESRKYDPLSHATLERVAKKFISIEKKDGYPDYCDEILLAFLNDEIALKEIC